MKRLWKKRFVASAIGTTAFLLGGRVAAYYMPNQHTVSNNPIDMLTHPDEYLEYGFQDITESQKVVSGKLALGLNYVHLAQAGDGKVSSYAFQKLARLEDLSDWEWLKIAQQVAFNYDLSVKLARTKGINPKLFLKPQSNQVYNPNHPHDRTEFLLKLLDAVKKVVPNASHCTQYFEMMAHKVNEEREYLGSDQEDLLVERARKRKYISPQRIDWLCLQALLGYCAAGEQACKSLAENGIFVALHRVRHTYKDDKEIMACVASILAELSEHSFSRHHFLQTRWFRVLTEWLEDGHIEISIPAAKCLYNLDGTAGSLLSESLYLLNPIYRNFSTQYDIVFVHGLLGCIYRTWRQDEANRSSSNYTRCWPKDWLPDDIKGLRILCVDYYTYLSDWNVECKVEKQTLEERSKSILEDLIRSGVGSRPTIWVAHSMGGLLVKQILTHCSKSQSPFLQKLVKNTKGVIFYSVPHKGSPLPTWPAKLELLALPSLEVRELLKDSPGLLSLHESFINIARQENIKCLSFGESLKSRLGVGKIKFSIMMVTEDSANPGIGEFIVLPTDHLHTCKPLTKDADSYRITLQFIRDTLLIST